jgi:methyltransferase-like protein
MASSKLQEMEKVSEANAVTANANPGDKAMPKLTTGGTAVSWEDLGGPTPQNSKPDDDSNKVKTPGGTIKQVSDVVTNRKGKTGAMGVQSASNLKQGDEAELTDEQEVVAETPVEEEVVETYDMEDDVNALLGGEELSEEFREKAKTIFEAAINAKVSEIKSKLDEEKTTAIEEAVAEHKAELTERTDSYLEYVAGEWLKENQLAVEHGLKTEMTESFLSGMKSLFEDHYVSIPDEKYDVVSTMVEKLDDMETKLNEQIEKNVALNKRLSESTSDVILGSVSEGLAATQKEKLATLAEGVEFESEESYKEKLTTLRESYFSDKKVAPQSSAADTLMEATDGTPVEQVSGSMESYMDVLGKMKN